MSPSHVELTDFTGMDFALKKNCEVTKGVEQNFWVLSQSARG